MRKWAAMAMIALCCAMSTAAVGRSRNRSHSSKTTSGPVCKKGKGCGNSCIARSAVCRQPKGTATNTEDEKDQPAADRK